MLLLTSLLVKNSGAFRPDGVPMSKPTLEAPVTSAARDNTERRGNDARQDEKSERL